MLRWPTSWERRPPLGVLSGPVVYDEAEDDGVIIQEQESVWGPIQVRVEVDVRDPVSVAQDVIGVNLDTSSIRHLGLALTELTTLLRDVGGQKDMILVSEGFSGALLETLAPCSICRKPSGRFETAVGLSMGGRRRNPRPGRERASSPVPCCS